MTNGKGGAARPRWLIWSLGLLLATLLAASLAVVWIGSETDMQPWEVLPFWPEPERISDGITPFEGIPGFGDPTATPTS